MLKILPQADKDFSLENLPDQTVHQIIKLAACRPDYTPDY